MGLSKAQQSLIEKARTVGGGKQGIALTDDSCAYLVGIVARDLGAAGSFPELPENIPSFFGSGAIDTRVVSGVNLMPLVERLFGLVPDADTYFASLAKLHKARLKYERILETQPIPTLEQIGPRALLEFGKLPSSHLAAYLFWRKWIYDIDNRAAQETGYLFEPVIAGAIGGVPVSARRSPIRRHDNPKKGRQIDCVTGNRAYEFKLRVTIAASGQGRWKEEIDFPRDCRESGYSPVLVVLDATPNPKLSELASAFRVCGGEVYIGEDAWHHLDEAAGPTMSIFLEKYVHSPIEALLREAPKTLPDLTFSARSAQITIRIGPESFSIGRESTEGFPDQPPQLPNDIDEELPGL